MRLDVVLHVLLELLGGDRPLHQADRRLDDLSADGVRRRRDAAFEHVRQLHDDVLDLGRPDPVARRLDDVVGAADVVVVPVLVLPRQVARVVDAAAPGLGRLLLVLVVAEEDAGVRIVARGAHDDFAVLARRHAVALFVHEVDAVVRDRLAHRAGLQAVADQVRQRERRLGLAEAFVDPQAGRLLELHEHLGVERLAGRRRVADGAEVVFRDVLLDEHPVHRRRCAECRDLVLGEHRQDLLRVEAREVVGEDRAFAEPLPVQLAPERLAPARLRDGEVQPVRLDEVPVLRRHVVPQRVLVAVQRHLRIARRARREEHEHRVVTAGRVDRPRIDRGIAVDLAVVGVPALALAVDDDLDERRRPRRRRQLLLGQLRLMGGLPVRRAEDRLDVARLEPVGEVVGHELVRRGNHHRADLVAGEDDRPELVVALQHEHDLVAPPDPQRRHEVRRAVRILRHVLEREAALGEVVGDVQHRQALRIAAGDLVHDVEGEVESLDVLERDVLQRAVRVLFNRDEVLHDARRGRLAVRGAHHRERLVALVRHDHREKRALLTADGDHPVRNGRTVEGGVARLQDLLMLADAQLELPAQDVVVLLAAMGRGVDRRVLEPRVVVVGDEIRCRLAVAEMRRHVADFDALLARRHDAFARARHLQVGELGRVPLQQRRQVDAEDERALVQERERGIALGRLDRTALLLAYAGPLRQPSQRQALDFAHLTNAFGDSTQRLLCLHRVHFLLSCLLWFLSLTWFGLRP